MSHTRKIIIAQLGSPRSPSVKDVRSFLKTFLGDPRVVDMNPFLWKIILNVFVLPLRPFKSAKAYARIWNGKEFPLVVNTREFAQKLKEYLPSDVEVDYAFLVCSPTPNEVMKVWSSQDWKTRAQEALIIPMFPQFSESTISSVFDNLAHELSDIVNLPEIKFMTSFHNSKAFIDNSVKNIKEHSEKFDHLVISFHGIPTRRVLIKDDIYYKHCFETFLLIKERLDIDESKIHMTFQSRFGSEPWLAPYTDEYVETLVENGNKRIGVYCPSFVADCLETTDEIGNELVEEVEQKGGEVTLIPCLNCDDDWSKDFAAMALAKLEGSKEQIQSHFYQTDKKFIEENIPEQKMPSTPLSDNAKKSLKIVFLTLFLDLIGFSIIFPMFPALAKYYLTVDSDNYFLQAIFGSISSLTSLTTNSAGMSPIVLFGGALGALYSLLQFIAAPFWGSVSDKIGRKPVLLVSIFGLFISYVIWIFSGSFTLLIVARIIGGLMGGNISTASAVVADVTETSNRSKGMAFIGIAFALGFIFGPALGGLLSLIDLTKLYPASVAYGVNPFSTPAIFAAILSAINVYLIAKNFKETLPEEKRGQGEQHRIANPFSLFKPLKYPEVNYTNWSYFLFISAFSGMEFTLTFLAVERLSFSPLDNGYMFIFIGFTLALIQGGYVRRKAAQVGEKKMAMQGLISVIPGLFIIAWAKSTFMLYFGLFFLAIGSAMAIPTLTSLVSLYTPESEQGRSLGIFRSLGSFGRVIGPILAALCYWKFGSAIPYIIGGVFMILPMIVLSKLPAKKAS